MEKRAAIMLETGLTFSITILAQSLIYMSAEVYDAPMGYYSANSDFLKPHFISNGWCPTQIHRIHETFPLQVQYYLYLLGPDKASKDHSKCTRDLCTGSHVNENDYRVQHACQPWDIGAGSQENSCICDLLEDYHATMGSILDKPPGTETSTSEKYYEVDSSKSASIVARGEIPLMSLNSSYGLDAPSHDLDPRLEHATPAKSYVALSHVWSDGLGNPNRNEIPLCQLAELRKSIEHIVGTGCIMEEEGRVYLWIDALCVPLAPVEARKTAIAGMAKVYISAFAVLVWEAGLRNEPCPSNIPEALARLLRSKWSSRLWTFQEANLARNICVQWGDQIQSITNGMLDWVTSDKARGDRLASSLMSAWFDVERVLSKQFRKSFMELTGGLREPDAEEAELLSMGSKSKILDVWSGINFRSTTKAADEYTCVSALLGLDVRKVLDAHDSQKLKTLLRLQKNFPSHMVFFNHVRMLDPGFGWAPKTFMQGSKPIDTDAISSGSARFTPLGLMYKWAGFYLEPNTTIAAPPSYHPFELPIENSRANLNTDQKKPKKQIRIMNFFHRPLYNDKDWVSCPKQWAVILPDTSSDMLAMKSANGRHNMCALVEVTRIEGNITFADYRCVGYIAVPTMNEEVDDDASAKATKATVIRQLPEFSLKSIKRVEPGHRWCIG